MSKKVSESVQPKKAFLVSSAQVAEALGIHPRTVRLGQQNGDLPGAQVLNGRFYFVREEIESRFPGIRLNS
jgi:hypothetical protein